MDPARWRSIVGELEGGERPLYRVRGELDGELRLSDAGVDAMHADRFGGRAEQI